MAIFNTQYFGGASQAFAWKSPHMTSNNSPEPYKVTAKGFTNSSYGYGEPYGAFDGHHDTGWYHNSSFGTWIEIQFGTDTTLDGVRVRPTSDGNSECIPKSIKVIGIASDESTTELFTLYPQNEIEWTAQKLDTPIKLQGIRLESHSGSYYGTTYYVIGDIEFHSLV